MPKTSSIHPTTSIEHPLVTGTDTASPAKVLAWGHADKNHHQLHYKGHFQVNLGQLLFPINCVPPLVLIKTET